MVIFYENKKYQEYLFKREEEFEAEVIQKSENILSENTIFIDAKKKIDSKNIDATIPDGFLFDLSYPENPEFYLVELS